MLELVFYNPEQEVYVSLENLQQISHNLSKARQEVIAADFRPVKATQRFWEIAKEHPQGVPQGRVHESYVSAAGDWVADYKNKFPPEPFIWRYDDENVYALISTLAQCSDIANILYYELGVKYETLQKSLQHVCLRASQARGGATSGICNIKAHYVGYLGYFIHTDLRKAEDRDSG